MNLATREADTSTPKNSVTGKREEELEFLKELEPAIQDDKKWGPKIKQQLAEMGKKQWGWKIGLEKLTSMLDKHPLPENRREMGVPGAYPEI